MKSALQTRLCVYRILQQIIFQHKTLETALESQPALLEMNKSDNHFVRLLVLTTLRRYGQTEELLKSFLVKPLSDKRQNVKLILIMGVVQLYFLKTPPHAAVDTAVELARILKQNGFTRLINGVLRSFVRMGIDVPEPALSENIPSWLYKSWVEMYGREKADSFCVACVSEPVLDITVKENPKEWAEKLNGTVLQTGTVRCSFSQAVPDMEGFEMGAWWVQEASASIPAQLFTHVSGLYGADLCAAPGGKTAQLIARGAQMMAYDVSASRLERLVENMKRLKMIDRLEICCQDVSTLVQSEVYDFVLLDAPCSATGTIKRHPDLFFHRTAADCNRLAELQKKLLAVALKLVKPGGEIVYATCSLQSMENEDVVQAVLADFKDVIRVIPTDERWCPFLNKNGAVQVTPDSGQDGFYAVLLRKQIRGKGNVGA